MPSIQQHKERFQMAKPDDRSDNVEKMQEAVQNTIDNLEESEHYLDEHSDELAPDEEQALVNKNENRRDAIESIREEIQDEARDNDKQ
jgi:small acid-soluble spore protein (thioredoxin-like protein)